MFFTTQICDQQLASKGDVVRVCRHAQMTDPPMLLLGLVTLVLLGVFFSEISGFGITLKREVQEARSAAQEAIRETRQIDVRHQQVQEVTADLAEGVRQALSRTQVGGQVSLPPSDDPIGRLAARYNEVRWTMSSGHARTRAMREVVEEMIRLFQDAPDFDIQSHLHSDDRGLRLAAAAYLYTNPDPAWARALARQAVREDKPYNEYWALKALREVLKGHCEQLDGETRSVLRHRMNALPPGTDRAEQIGRLLRGCPEWSDGRRAI
ncbi:hypothetical protein ACF1FE_30155 [Streptomyces griseofuscus]|uniref:hypothetical protein n=1 Tax=Streptomyces griseofuscus TaxID=146922 RepID=UPI0036F96460